MLPVSGIPPDHFPLSEKALQNVEMIECTNQAQKHGGNSFGLAPGAGDAKERLGHLSLPIEL